MMRPTTTGEFNEVASGTSNMRQPTGYKPAERITHGAKNSSTTTESEDSFDDLCSPLLHDCNEVLNNESAGEDDEIDEFYQDGSRLRHNEIPRERHKTFIAFALLFFAGALNDVVLSYIHEKIPDTDPLPDIAFEHTPYWPWALTVSEIIMIASFITMITIAIAHRNRWIVLRRIATIGFLLYLFRCVTMFVTQVPKADKNYYCAPKLKPDERTVWTILFRAISVLVGLGLQINGRHTLCGDYIYSGHTVVHVTCYLFIKQYSPKNWRVLHNTSLLFSSLGIVCLLVSRAHYSIDIIIAYWITTRIFWQYHSLAEIPLLRTSLGDRNHVIKEIWVPLLRYMEANVQKPLPRRYKIPFLKTIQTNFERLITRSGGLNVENHAFMA